MNQPIADSGIPRESERRTFGIKRKLVERRARKKRESAQDKAAKTTARATALIAVFAFVTVWVGVFQYWAIKGQLDEMRSAAVDTRSLIETNAKLANAATAQATESQRQSVAIDRQSTFGRAYLFCENPGLDFSIPLPIDRESRHVKYTIKNYGSSFGVITKIETHFYFAHAWNEPDPMGDSGRETMEDNSMDTIGTVVRSEISKNSPGSSDGDFGSGRMQNYDSDDTKTFILREGYQFEGKKDFLVADFAKRMKYAWEHPGPNERKPIENIPDGWQNVSFWFYCKVDYKDIFGIERWSSHYYQLRPNAAEAKNQSYNKWN